MATKNLLILSMVALVMVFTSCKDKEDDEPCEPTTEQLTVTVQPLFGGEILHLDSTYTTAEGYGVQFTDLKFFAENVRGPVQVLKDAALFDYRETGTNLFTAEGKHTDFTSLNGNLGVQSSINHSDPSAFPNDNVLNISNSGGMHWGWNPGYRFLAIEGKSSLNFNKANHTKQNVLCTTFSQKW